MADIPQAYDFKKVEKDVADRWDKLQAKIKATTQFNSKKKIFSFLEGPPTANAPPALHHMEMRIFKDVMCRFKHMQGFTVPRKGGWDCHGLPVEVQVEKKLGLKTKKDVLTYGIEKFNKECRTDVFTFIKHWEENTKKLAYWIDLDNPYRTLDNSYIESVWWSLKELHKKGFLYEGHKVVPYCPRCETPLSSHEVALGYKDVSEDTITVKFQLKDNPKRCLLAWTTTPWTLPSNVCLAVNKNIVYAVVKEGNREYVLAKDLVDKYFDDAQIIQELKGEKLVGLKYSPLFDYFADKFSDAWVVVGEDYVSTEEGTGIVHQAPAFGEIDYDSCKKHGLPFVQPVDASGKFTDEVYDFKGLFVKDADPKIIEHLLDKDLLFKREKYVHSYPFCWRCSTPLLYYAMVSWFIAVSKIKDRLMELNKEIIWYPSHIKEGRFGKWLESAKDWALSRTKFWGTPLPIWRCDTCKNVEVIGSVKELQDKGDKVSKDVDLHKPYVDNVKLKCSCGKTMSRIPDVIDCWYDSGAAPFAQLHYPFENKELFEKYHPYDFIAEGLDQTRGWFYTLHVLSAILFDKLAYKRCAVGGLLCDEKGEKMSKSRGNIIVPEEMFEKVGVDAVRILMCSYPFGENINFGMKPINDTINPFIKILWNCFYYINQYYNIHEINVDEEKTGALLLEDRWIISKVNSLVDDVTNNLDNGQFNHAISGIQNFVNNSFSRTYIKLVRDRADEHDDALAYTFYYVISRVINLLAPFAPYLSDQMYDYFVGAKESVHFEEWPGVEDVNKMLEQDVELLQEVISAVNYAREKASLGLRWPVKEVIVATDSKQLVQALNESGLVELFKSQTNVKLVNPVASFAKVKEKIRINSAKLGKDFGDKSPKIIAKLSVENNDAIMRFLAKDGKFVMKLDKSEVILTKDHFIYEREIPSDFVGVEFSLGMVYLDKTRNSELDNEGFAREVVRRIQVLRKNSGFVKTDSAELYVYADELESVLKNYADLIKEKCGVKNLMISSKKPGPGYKFSSEEKIKDKKVMLNMNKI